MTLADRAAAFAQTFPQWPAAHPRLVREQDRDVLYATWLLGNDYRNPTGFYGAYPPGFLDRVLALFPDHTHQPLLHVFSGSLPAGNYLRCDSRKEAEYRCSVYALPDMVDRTFRLIVADPPYSRADAVKYGTPMIDRRKALAALAVITEPGGFCAWLDTTWPMHRKAEWLTVGRIAIVRSTNHRVRLVSLFERTQAEIN